MLRGNGFNFCVLFKKFACSVTHAKRYLNNATNSSVTTNAFKILKNFEFQKFHVFFFLNEKSVKHYTRLQQNPKNNRLSGGGDGIINNH